jgi:hypothetical protein
MGRPLRPCPAMYSAMPAGRIWCKGGCKVPKACHGPGKRGLCGREDMGLPAGMAQYMAGHDRKGLPIHVYPLQGITGGKSCMLWAMSQAQWQPVHPQ